MRYIRLRWHSSIFIGLTSLTFIFLITIYLLIHSAGEFEVQPAHPVHPRKPSVTIPFWSALNQQNIYDLYAPHLRKNKPSAISSRRIDELYQLVRQTRQQRSYYSFVNISWNFPNFLREKTQINANDTNILVDTADSARDGGNGRSSSDLSTPSRSMTENDKRQLRYFLHYKLNEWKINHQNDKTITLAEIMRDTLLQDQPE